MTLKENEDVLLILDDRRKYLIKVEPAKRFHTHKGYIDTQELLKKSYGEKIKSNIGVDFHICKPTLIDYIPKLIRKTQIIYPKDAMYIVLVADIKNGSRVVEIGTGSGALTCVLANFVKTEGHVYSYEIKEELIKIASKNLERLGLQQYVTLKNKDASTGIEEKEVDSLVMDVPNPWDFLDKAKEVLKPSGILVAFCLTINQMEKLVKAMLEKKFIDVHVVEILEREYQVDPTRLRPKTRMIGHSGYIVWGRNVL